MKPTMLVFWYISITKFCTNTLKERAEVVNTTKRCNHSRSCFFFASLLIGGHWRVGAIVWWAIRVEMLIAATIALRGGICFVTLSTSRFSHSSSFTSFYAFFSDDRWPIHRYWGKSNLKKALESEPYKVPKKLICQKIGKERSKMKCLVLIPMRSLQFFRCYQNTVCFVFERS